MLPKGMTLDQAATGFRNQGQFIAALHVSQNLGVQFADLRSAMVGNQQSLGQSIHTLKPAANATNEAKRATGQADNDAKLASQ